MARNRRNKRSGSKKITDYISFKTFIILVIVLVLIIIACTSIIRYRNQQDIEMLAKQKEELDKQIEEIFSETEKTIINSNSNKPDRVIRISAVGDILCGSEMLEDAKQKDNTYTFDYMFQNITSYIKNSDIVLGTMETNFTANPYSGYGNRNSPKEFGMAVKKSGINLVSISTNHSLDYGINGLKETKKYLQEIGFSTVGDRLEKETVNIQKIKDAKIAFLSYTYGVEDSSSKSKKDLESLNIFNEKIAKEDLEYAKENADYIFVIMHWGDDYATVQSKEQEKVANFLIENGANVILGNHPAVIQPMEVRETDNGDVFIAYSLGNYISSINYEASKVELVLNIELRKRGEDGKIVLSKVDYTPIYVLDNGEKAKNRYELIDMKGVAKEYAGGNTSIVDKKTYNKLLDGLKLLKEVIGR